MPMQIGNSATAAVNLMNRDSALPLAAALAPLPPVGAGRDGALESVPSMNLVIVKLCSFRESYLLTAENAEVRKGRRRHILIEGFSLSFAYLCVLCGEKAVTAALALGVRTLSHIVWRPDPNCVQES